MEQQDGNSGDRDAFADIIDPAALLGAAGAAGADLGSGIGGGLGGIIEVGCHAMRSPRQLPCSLGW